MESDDVREGDEVLIPYGRGYRGEIVRVYPPESTCEAMVSARYLDGPYAGLAWGGPAQRVRRWPPA